MSVKLKLTVAEYQALSEAEKANYKSDGDSGYQLDIVGGFVVDKDPAALLNSRDHEKAKRKEAEAKLKELQDAQQKTIDDAKKEAAEAARKAALEGGDVAAITEQLEARIADQEAKYQAELAKRDEAIALERQQAQQSRMDAHINSIVGNMKITDGSEDYMRYEIKQKLAFDDNGNIIVKDNPETTPDNFVKSIVDDSKYAGIMVASKASGASGSQTPGSPVDTNGKYFDDLTSDELVDLHRSNPDEYQRLKAVGSRPNQPPAPAAGGSGFGGANSF